MNWEKYRAQRTGHARGPSMRYAVHDTMDASAIQLYEASTTSQILDWLRDHGRGFCDLTISDRQAERSTRIQRGWS